ncbi:hypothetical protein A6302_04476 [Methylobrevis pamukkalensis]|uniref:Uncharacterized protein n=1 Tax=Methylobrevis pamukkalensis TaxID=1439726 RepID=A0A1E3GPP3_9HYPH|nr:hypothetical protein A6302_04476 [Methylobrevis pamukkalensis]
MRTGQAQGENITLGEFKTEVCGGVLAYFDCESKIYIDSRVLASFADADNTVPLDEDGELEPSQSFQLGTTSQIVQVRTFLPWSRMVPLLPVSGTKTSGGDMLLSATSIFRNEPFPN